METRVTDSILPYDKNPRVNDKGVEHVLESLKKHGQIKPLVLSAIGHPFEHEVLCCGHTTLLALKRFGAKTVSVVTHTFKDEAEFVDFNIRDNKSGEFSMWDDTLLSELSTDYSIDLSEMGFDIDDLEDVSGNSESDGMSEHTGPFDLVLSFENESKRAEYVHKYSLKPDKADGPKIKATM